MTPYYDHDGDVYQESPLAPVCSWCGCCILPGTRHLPEHQANGTALAPGNRFCLQVDA